MPKFNVKKTIQIDAPAEKVYTIVRDFKQWPRWSPWLIAEPECRLDFSEHGRSYSWDGKIVGAGEMGIISEQEGKSIDYRLVFLKPWKSVASVRFEFEDKNGGTRVVWSMEGSLPFFMFFMKNMMAAFVGMDYERGLKMLKDYAETDSVPSKLDFIGRETIKGFQYVGTKSGCSTDEISDSMQKAMDKVKAYMKETGLEPAGKPFSLYHKFDPVKRIAIFTAGYPIASIPGNLPSDIVFGRQNDCEVYSTRHTGPYRHLGNVWASGMMRARAKVFRQNKRVPCFETYSNEPDDTEENDLITTVHLPAK